MSGRNSATAYLALGGNIGDPRDAMAKALRMLDADAETSVLAVSPLYRTPPWGKTDQPDYLNAAARVETGLGARRLLARALAIEQALHRVRAERWGPRSIDIDLLLYGDQHISEPGLKVPHPRMLERAFVMVPLADIAPTLVLDGMATRAHAERLGQTGMSRLTPDGDWWKD